MNNLFTNPLYPSFNKMENYKQKKTKIKKNYDNTHKNYTSNMLNKSSNINNPSDINMNVKTKIFNPFGMYKNDEKNIYVYYTGSGNLYKNITTKDGYLLLENLSNIVKEQYIKFKNKYPDDYYIQYKEAKLIYETKSSLKTSGETWSNEEYNMYNFLYYYCQTKSIQRYTECWTGMNLAMTNSLLNKLFEKKKLNIISFAGGPSYELIAINDFIKKINNEIEIKFVSYDLSNAWKDFIPVDYIEFKQADVCDIANTYSGKTKILKDDEMTFLLNTDMIMISYAWYMYFSKMESFNIFLKACIENGCLLFIMERTKHVNVDIFNSYNISKLYNNTTRQVIISKDSVKENSDHKNKYNYFKTALY